MIWVVLIRLNYFPVVPNIDCVDWELLRVCHVDIFERGRGVLVDDPVNFRLEVAHHGESTLRFYLHFPNLHWLDFREFVCLKPTSRLLNYVGTFRYKSVNQLVVFCSVKQLFEFSHCDWKHYTLHDLFLV